MDTPSILSSAAERARAAFEAAGVAVEVRELPASTHTAAEAATAIGCRPEQIAKSVVFRGRESGRPVLVVASGPTRIDPARVGPLVGERIKIADRAFVEEATGFPVGGVPPLPPPEARAIVVDEALLALEAVWAAAGTAHAVVRLDRAGLLAAAGANVLVGPVGPATAS